MDDLNTLPPTLPFDVSAGPSGSAIPEGFRSRGWQAALDLTFDVRDGRTYLAKRAHVGPLVIQKTLHPEGNVCHGIVVHPPGGVAGGDQLRLSAQLQTSAHALLTTPGAGKWYKANHQTASQVVTVNLAERACMEWFPQENILFDGADVRLETDVQLSEDAQFATWDIVCFGRQAKQETWQTGRLVQRLNIRRGTRLIWNERSHLTPEAPVMRSVMGMRGQVVSGAMTIAAGHLSADLLSQCREVAAPIGAHVGMSALPEIFTARYVGDSSQAARHYFEQLWQILRPWYASKKATRPRIWNT